MLLAASSYTLPAPGPGVWEPTMLPDSTLVPPVDPWMAVLDSRSCAPRRTNIAPLLPRPRRPGICGGLNEVKDIGGAMSTTRTPAQTQVAQFWTTNMVIQTNASYRQLSSSRALNLIETARLMAMGNMLATDSLIATFDAKYTYNFWRPVTAIRHTNPDGSYSATEINSWMPPVMTPSFPEYVAGHGSFVSAQAELYTRFFGTPQIEIDLESSRYGYNPALCHRG